MKPSLFSIYKFNSILTKNKKLNVSMGSNRQPSNGLKFNRHSSKKIIFYRQP